MLSKLLSRRSKQNLRQPLTTDELARVVAPEELSDSMVVGDGDDVDMVDKRKEDKRKEDKSKFIKRSLHRGVKQAKIVQQTERVDSLTEKGGVKGMDLSRCTNMPMPYVCCGGLTITLMLDRCSTCGGRTSLKIH